MAVYAQLADGRLLEFPDNTPPEVMERAVKSFIASETPPAQGLGAAFVGGAKRFGSSLQTGFESLFDAEGAAKRGLERQELLGQQYAPATSLEAVKKAYAERGILPAAGEAISQIPGALAEQFPNIAATLAGAKTGALTGARFGPKGAIVGGLAGAAAPAFAQLFGSGLERQAEEGVDISRGRAAAAAAPGAALEVASTLIPLGKTIVGKILGPQAEKALAKGTNESIERLAKETVAKSLAKGVGVGALAEIPTEVTQQMLERLQAGLPLTTDEAFAEYGEAAYGAGLVGGPFGAVGRVAQRGVAKDKIAGEQAEERRLQEELAAAEKKARLTTPEYRQELNGKIYNLKDELAQIEPIAKDKTQDEDVRNEAIARAKEIKGELKDLQAKFKESMKEAGLTPTLAQAKAAGFREMPVVDEFGNIVKPRGKQLTEEEYGQKLEGAAKQWDETREKIFALREKEAADLEAKKEKLAAQVDEQVKSYLRSLDEYDTLIEQERVAKGLKAREEATKEETQQRALDRIQKVIDNFGFNLLGFRSSEEVQNLKKQVEDLSEPSKIAAAPDRAAYLQQLDALKAQLQKAIDEAPRDTGEGLQRLIGEGVVSRDVTKALGIEGLEGRTYRGEKAVEALPNIQAAIDTLEEQRQKATAAFKATQKETSNMLMGADGQLTTAGMRLVRNEVKLNELKRLKSVIESQTPAETAGEAATAGTLEFTAGKADEAIPVEKNLPGIAYENRIKKANQKAGGAFLDLTSYIDDLSAKRYIGGAKGNVQDATKQMLLERLDASKKEVIDSTLEEIATARIARGLRPLSKTEAISLALDIDGLVDMLVTRSLAPAPGMLTETKTIPAQMRGTQIVSGAQEIERDVRGTRELPFGVTSQKAQLLSAKGQENIARTFNRLRAAEREISTSIEALDKQMAKLQEPSDSPQTQKLNSARAEALDRLRTAQTETTRYKQELQSAMSSAGLSAKQALQAVKNVIRSIKQDTIAEGKRPIRVEKPLLRKQFATPPTDLVKDLDRVLRMENLQPEVRETLETARRLMEEGGISENLEELLDEQVGRILRGTDRPFTLERDVTKPGGMRAMAAAGKAELIDEIKAQMRFDSETAQATGEQMTVVPKGKEFREERVQPDLFPETVATERATPAMFQRLQKSKAVEKEKAKVKRLETIKTAAKKVERERALTPENVARKEKQILDRIAMLAQDFRKKPEDMVSTKVSAQWAALDDDIKAQVAELKDMKAKLAKMSEGTVEQKAARAAVARQQALLQKVKDKYSKEEAARKEMIARAGTGLGLPGTRAKSIVKTTTRKKTKEEYEAEMKAYEALPAKKQAITPKPTKYEIGTVRRVKVVPIKSKEEIDAEVAARRAERVSDIERRTKVSSAQTVIEKTKEEKAEALVKFKKAKQALAVAIENVPQYKKLKAEVAAKEAKLEAIKKQQSKLPAVEKTDKRKVKDKKEADLKLAKEKVSEARVDFYAAKKAFDTFVANFEPEKAAIVFPQIKKLSDKVDKAKAKLQSIQEDLNLIPADEDKVKRQPSRGPIGGAVPFYDKKFTPDQLRNMSNLGLSSFSTKTYSVDDSIDFAISDKEGGGIDLEQAEKRIREVIKKLDAQGKPVGPDMTRRRLVQGIGAGLAMPKMPASVIKAFETTKLTEDALYKAINSAESWFESIVDTLPKNVKDYNFRVNVKSEIIYNAVEKIAGEDAARLINSFEYADPFDIYVEDFIESNNDPQILTKIKRAYDVAATDVFKYAANKLKDLETTVEPTKEVSTKAATLQTTTSPIKFIYFPTMKDVTVDILKSMARQGVDIYETRIRGGVKPDGTVFVIGENHTDMTDLEKTIAHEFVGHYSFEGLLGEGGMKKLLGRVDKAFGSVFKLADTLGVRADADAAYMQGLKFGMTPKDAEVKALREVVAYTMEKRVDQKFLAKAKRWLQELVGAMRSFFKGLGMDMDLSTSDLFYMMKQANEAFEAGKPIAYKKADGTIDFRGAKSKYAPGLEDLGAITDKIIGRQEGMWSNIKANVTGLTARVQFVDRFAALEALVKRGVSKGIIDSLKAADVMYFSRMADQRHSFVAEIANNGTLKLKDVKRPDGRTEKIIESERGANLKEISQALMGAGVGNAEATGRLFTLYLAAERAQRVGIDKLNFGGKITKADLDKALAFGRSNQAFQKARDLYNEYNKGLIDFAVQTGALSKEEGARLSKTNDYVPFYRMRGGNVELVIGSENPIRIGDIKTQPYLQELVGGDEAIMDFFTSSLQNTTLLTDMALRNLATRNAAFVLGDLGVLAKKGEKGVGIRKGDGTAGPNTIRFKLDGEPHHVVIDTQAKEDVFGDIPADLVVKGMEGMQVIVPGVVRGLAGPANWLRKFVTRDPRYAVRQIFRDSMAAALTTGADIKPVITTMGEIAKMYSKGGSEAFEKLQRRGILGGQVITGAPEDMAKIMQQIASGKSGWDMAMAKLDQFAMAGDAGTRMAMYNSFLKQGLSEREATLAALESMNFGRRGVSPSIYFLNATIPFFNAGIQGIDVLYRAFTKQMPYEEQLRVQKKLLMRGGMMALFTLAYVAMMQDDEAYKNAEPEQRYANWFIRIPGIDEPFRVPIPFEVGLLFKAVPEGIYNATFGDEKGSKVAKDLTMQLLRSLPGNPAETGVPVPTAIKPFIETALNKSFFTGRDIVDARLEGLEKEFQYRDKTPEILKTLGPIFSAIGLSPVQMENFVRAYTGSLGVGVLSLANPVLKPSGGAGEVEGRVSEIPLVGGLFQPNDAGRVINEAYDSIKEIQQKQGSFKKLLEEGKIKEAEEYVKANAGEIGLASFAGSFRQRMGELTKTERAIKAAPAEQLSPQEKRKQLDEIRKIKIQMANDFKSVREQIERQGAR